MSEQKSKEEIEKLAKADGEWFLGSADHKWLKGFQTGCYESNATIENLASKVVQYEAALKQIIMCYPHYDQLMNEDYLDAIIEIRERNAIEDAKALKDLKL